MRRGPLCLKVEVIAGSSEGETALAMTQLADRLGILVETQHNDTTMRAWPGDEPEAVLRQFALERNLENYPSPN